MDRHLDYWEYHIREAKDLIDKASNATEEDKACLRQDEWIYRALVHSNIALVLQKAQSDSHG